MPDLLDTILQDFRDSKRKVNRHLSFGIVFSLVCFFFILWPYFQYKAQQESAQQAGQYLEAELQTLNESLTHIKRLKIDARNSLQEVQAQIRGLPDHLHREALPEIAEIINSDSLNRPQIQQRLQIQQVQSTGSPGEIHIPPGITDFNEAVNWYIRNWFNNLVTQIEDSLIATIALIIPSNAENRTDDLEILMQKGKSDINEYIKTVDLDFWHRYRGLNSKVSTTSELQAVVNESFDPKNRSQK